MSQRLDDLQIRIMKELASPSSFRWNVRESYASIAGKIGVDEETVRRRVKRAFESGFLKGWQLVLNPHLIGLESAGVQLEVDDASRKADVISKIETVEGVVIIIDFHGKGLRAIFYHGGEGDLAGKIQQISTICRRKEIVLWKGGFPPCDLKLRKTDWEIVRALRNDPRRSPSEVAREVKVSTRTVKRRLTVMMEGRAFFMLPMLVYGKSVGVSCDFLIFCPDARKKSALDKQVASKVERMTFAFTEAPGFSIFAVVCANMLEAEELQAWIEAMEGVEDLRMDIMRENILVGSWLDREIQKRVSEA